MRFKALLLVLPVAAALWLGPGAEPARADSCSYPHRGRRCTTPPARPGGKALTERMLAGARRLGPGERIVVPIVYHLIYEHSCLPEEPGVPPDDLQHTPPVALVLRQTEVLNHAFRGTAISFLNAGVDVRSFAPWRTRNSVGCPAPEDEVDMIVDLNAGRRGALHVFLLDGAATAAAPPETKKMFEDFRRRTDGISMPWDYLPFDEVLRPDVDDLVRRYFFEGETLVHLVGHYLGLLHTFERWPVEGEPPCATKCAQVSDRVRDTPVHLGGSSGTLCAPLDTCPQYPGLDPVANYMNREPDACASEFTAGQVERIERMVRAFRPYLIVGAPAGQP
jgi:Pregnancy-associated plasma protein-A